MRPTYAEINLSNLIFNYQSISKKVGKNVEVMPVVKADAYGHGMIKCVEALLETKPKPKYFAVAYLEEALELRKYFANLNILVFGKIYPKYFKQILHKNITPTFFEKELIEIYNDVAKKLNTIGKFHLKVDTGMGRVGAFIEDAKELILLIKNLSNVYLEGIYTHFASSDSKDKSFAHKQLEKFLEIVDFAKKELKKIKYFHAANSGAILDLPESYFNMVRPGISLYGYYPSDETSESIPLKPVMSIKTKLSYLKWVEKDTSISYGRTFFTKEKTQIGTLPIGYADGYNRLLSNRGKVILNNKFYPVVGRVTMDQIMVDFGSDNVNINDEIIVLGRSENIKFDASDIARVINTIPYEVCTSISKRVIRKFKY